MLIGAKLHVAPPGATALAITGDRITAIGSDREIRALAGPRTQVIELAGASVTPGLIDAHCHLYGLGLDLESASLREATSEQAAVELAAKFADDATRRGAAASGDWVVGRGWDQNRWPGQRFPTKSSLDRVLADRPVVLRRIDGHAAWVNSKALAAAAITTSTRDPAGGRIVRDDRGEPTGVLIDNAVDLVDRAIPEPSGAQRRARILAAAEQARRAGLTGVHEMGIDDATVAVYEQLAERGELPLRVYAYLAGDPADLARVRRPPKPPVGRFTLRGVKYFADGALGSRGARLLADYSDDPNNRGLWVTTPERLAQAVEVAVGAGWQTAIHAIGDAAVASVIDAYAAAERKYPGDHRLRIEHLQMIDLGDLPRLVETHAIASMQPTHATSDMPWAEKRVGSARIRGAYAWRTMLDKGVPLAAGSDFPVEDVRPLLGIYAAVTRQDALGEPAGGWYPAQRLTLDEAIAAFTRGGAYAEFAEGERGELAVGKVADLTVYDRPLAADKSLLSTSIRMTIVGGEVTYASEPSERAPSGAPPR